MSDKIRNHVHDFVDAHLTDDALERIRRVLMAAPEAHKVPVNLKLVFEVDKTGLAKLTTGMTTSLSVAAWDVPIKITAQLSLFDEPTALVSTPTKSEHPAIAPDPPERTIPDVDLSEPGFSPLADDTPAAKRIAAIEAKNAEILAAAEKSGARLSPAAKAALKDRT